MNKELLELAKAEARKEGRSLSNWLEQLVKKGIIPLLAFLAFHTYRSPNQWTTPAFLATGKAAIALLSRSIQYPSPH